jgi:protein gp37
MNKQKLPKGIEWTRIRQIIDGEEIERDGYTWNPTGGCKHGCTWQMPDGSITECYAKTIAERFTKAYDRGFDAHYWRPHLLNAPLKVKDPSGIFVGSMADLFGHWVPDEEIHQVIDVMREADWHIFQTLSKFPIRLPKFNPYPQNVWVGVSVPAGHLMSKTGGVKALQAYLRHMKNIEASIRFMSIEPLWFDVAPVFEAWLEQGEDLPFEWVIIGAATNGSKTFQPKYEWTASLVDLLERQNIPIFFKGNLEWSDWRDEFPNIIKSSKKVPVV